jgi:hypothetical protein
VRTILCEFDTLADTFTFKEVNYAGQDPGPYDERTAAYFTSTPQATSKTGAELLLGEIIAAGSIVGL